MQFELTEYLDEIRAISKHNKCTVTVAVDRMVVNLNTFREYYKGTGTLNYHAIGHLWGMLPAAEKVAQKSKVKELVSATPSRARYRRS